MVLFLLARKSRRAAERDCWSGAIKAFMPPRHRRPLTGEHLSPPGAKLGGGK
jgi:hypothetical protein